MNNVDSVLNTPNVIFAPVNINGFAFAFNKFFIGIPKNLITTMSAFVVSFFFGFVGDFL